MQWKISEIVNTTSSVPKKAKLLRKRGLQRMVAAKMLVTKGKQTRIKSYRWDTVETEVVDSGTVGGAVVEELFMMIT